MKNSPKTASRPVSRFDLCEFDRWALCRRKMYFRLGTSLGKEDTPLGRQHFLWICRFLSARSYFPVNRNGFRSIPTYGVRDSHSYGAQYRVSARNVKCALERVANFSQFVSHFRKKSLSADPHSHFARYIFVCCFASFITQYFGVYLSAFSRASEGPPKICSPIIIHMMDA